MTSRLPLAGASGFGRIARRTTVVRIALACALTGALITAIVVAARDRHDPGAFGRSNRHTVLVLDVSASIRPGVYRQVDEALRRAIRGGGEVGLVAFSDVAYELLPLGTPVKELEPVDRFYRSLRPVPPGVRTVSLGTSRYLRAPWGPTLTQGTKISTGLETALGALTREGDGSGRAVLVSDLGDEIGDLSALGRVIDLYASRHVPIDVVALSAQPQDVRLFRSLLAGGRGSVVEAAAPGADAGSGAGRRVPVGLLAAAAALLAVLAVNEAFGAKLVLRSQESMS
jgi:hypothetical protein